MQLFYSENIQSDRIILEGQEAIHCNKVLRKKHGDTLYVLDGKGKRYITEVVASSKNQIELTIQEIEIATVTNEHLPIIAIGIIKNTSRLEWFIEKATEIGIHSIYLLACQRSERSKVNRERLDKIIVSAMKQSMRWYKPHLHELTKFSDFCNLEINANKIMGHYHIDNPTIAEIMIPNQQNIMLIGPEGDFTDKETVMAQNAGYQTVNLGNSRLRTETAGVVACTLLNNLS